MARGASETGTTAELLRTEARRAARGEDAAPQAVIDASDRDLNRLLRRGSAEERAGLLSLLGRVGRRGKRVAERALTSDGFRDEVRLELLRFLAERQPQHPLPEGFAAVGRALDDGDDAAELLAELPPTLRACWARACGAARMNPPSPAMEALLEADDEAAGVLLEGLDETVTGDTVDRLRRLAERTSSRSLVRAIRSTFFRLEQRGVVVRPTGSAPARDAVAVERVADAYLTAVDSAGDQALWILEELPEGRVSMLQAILDDSGSLSSARATTLVRRGHDRVVQELVADLGTQITRIDVAEAMALVEEAYAHNPAAAGDEYLAWRRLNNADRRARSRPLGAAPEDRRDALVARSAALTDGAGCSPWLLRRGDAERAEKMLAEAEDSPLVLPGREEQRRHRAGMEQVIAALWPAPQRERTARRLLGTARFLDLTDDREGAQIALATADAVRRDPTAVPLLEALVDASLKALAEVREREKNEKVIAEP